VKIGHRVLLGYFAIVGLAAYFVLTTFREEVKPGVKQGMEVALVDAANLLAQLATPEFLAHRSAGNFEDSDFARGFREYQQRSLAATIHDFAKVDPSYRVYITDQRGIVRYDSAGTDLGADYSRWNDVRLTLAGQYGARSSRARPDDERTSAMYVAAPILEGENIVGVLTVSAPSASVMPYAKRSQERVLRAGMILMASALAIGIWMSLSLGGAIARLKNYAQAVAQGERVNMPKLPSGEVAELGQALESMRSKLEDRHAIERYVTTLTHEMKSPLAAIRGAAELLEEEMPEGDRQRFIANIREQEARLRVLLDRLLEQAALEQRRGLENPQTIEVSSWIQSVVANKDALLVRHNLTVACDVVPGIRIKGELFLLEQALGNLIDNAIAFAPSDTTLEIRVRDVGCLESSTPMVRIDIEDRGTGLPPYALERIFSPFYSLPNPKTGKKGTGLGLRFVRDVAALHGGEAGLENREGGGASAWLLLPRMKI
jgi:two-component system sensor histidine kinase CreC